MKINGIEYGGQHATGLTFTLTPDVKAGDAVSMGDVDGTAGRIAGEPLLGKCVVVEKDGRGTVLNRGVIVVRWVGPGGAGQASVIVTANGAAQKGEGGTICNLIGVQDGYAAIDLG